MAAVKNSERRPASRRGPPLPEPKDVSSPDAYLIALLAPRWTAHPWVHGGDAANPYTVLDLSVGRSRDAPAAFHKGYQGFVHANGYAPYNRVYAGGATHVGCSRHAPGYSFDARFDPLVWPA